MGMKKGFMILLVVLFLISLFFAVQGVMMHAQVAPAEAEFHALQEEYFSIDKATRDAAPSDSELNAQLAEIKNTPSELLRLKLVGVGKILTGIYVLLFAILLALAMMPMRLSMMMKKRK